MRLRCRLGIHDWSTWEPEQLQVTQWGVPVGEPFVGQSRFCKACGFREYHR